MGWKRPRDGAGGNNTRERGGGSVTSSGGRGEMREARGGEDRWGKNGEGNEVSEVVKNHSRGGHNTIREGPLVVEVVKVVEEMI